MITLFHCHANVMSVTGVAVMLQSRAPTGYWLGPASTLLLSSPTTFHSVGVIVSALVFARAGTAPARGAMNEATSVSTATNVNASVALVEKWIANGQAASA